MSNSLFSEEHKKHILGGYLKKGCEECYEFVSEYIIYRQPKKVITFV